MEIVSFDPHAIKLYVDGSCLRNPGGSSGFAVWVEYPAEWNRADENLEETGFLESTNNRMELRACIWAHKWVRDQSSALGAGRIQIITDSKYVHENWRRAEYWRTNRWRNVEGRPIENSDLWRELLSIRSKLRIRTDIEWTLGKKAPILKAVDKSAKSAAKSPTTTDRGYRPGKVGRTRNRTSGAAILFPASGQDALIRIYQSSAFANGENKIKFQLFSDMRGDFFEKFIGYASPEIGALLHRHHFYRVRFNSNPKYPTIVTVIEEVV